MRKPKPITQRIRTLLALRGMTVSDMGAAINRTEGTLRNVITGATRQPPTREAITNFLGAEIFPGLVPLNHGIGVNFPAGTVLTLPGEPLAGIVADLLGSAAERTGLRITLLQPAIFRIPRATATPQTAQLK